MALENIIMLVSIVLFSFSLTYVLKHMRRFYPAKLQEKMAKEEACTLKVNKKPEMKAMRKNVFIGFVLSIIISYIISYYLIASVDNTFRTFTNIFIGLFSLVAIYAMVTEYKINKDKNCNDMIVGYKFMKWVGIFMGLVFVIALIIAIIVDQ